MEKRSNRPKLFNSKKQQQWSEERKYKHIHTGEYCTFEAYLAEYLVLRWTQAFNMDKPSYKFWTVGDKYHEVFIRNMKAANSLKKKFEESTIIEAINSEYFKNIYHVGLKAYGPRGWKYNQVALEAIKSYNKEKKKTEKLKNDIKHQSKKAIIEEEKKLVERRTRSYGKKKSVINQLRNK